LSDMLKCKKCGSVKPKDAFHKSKTGLGVRRTCKACAEDNRRARLRTKHGKRAHQSQRLQHVYGITLDDYDRMFAAQDGVCVICSEPETKMWRGHTGRAAVTRLCVDHDHDTGKVRELLCDRCNKLLGFARDDIDILTKVINYINKHKGA